jgi:hypothetical protein
MMNTTDSDDDLHCCHRNCDGGDEGTAYSAIEEVSYGPWPKADISCLEV